MGSNWIMGEGRKRGDGRAGGRGNGQGIKGAGDKERGRKWSGKGGKGEKQTNVSRRTFPWSWNKARSVLLKRDLYWRRSTRSAMLLQYWTPTGGTWYLSLENTMSRSFVANKCYRFDWHCIGHKQYLKCTKMHVFTQNFAKILWDLYLLLGRGHLFPNPNPSFMPRSTIPGG